VFMLALQVPVSRGSVETADQSLSWLRRSRKEAVIGHLQDTDVLSGLCVKRLERLENWQMSNQRRTRRLKVAHMSIRSEINGDLSGGDTV